MLFNKTRQYSNNIQFFNKMIFSRYRTRQIKATETNKLIKAAEKTNLFLSIVLKKKRKEMFYLWLYGVRHRVKYHTDSERGNPLSPHGLLFFYHLLSSYTPHRNGNQPEHYCSYFIIIVLTPFNHKIKMF